MAKKKKTVPLTWREGQGYTKDCGSILDEDGVRKYKRWYFGADKSNAERLAGITLAEWKIIKLNGGDAWTNDALSRIEFARLGMVGVPNPAVVTPPATDSPSDHSIAIEPSSSKRSVHQAMLAYEAELDQRASSGQVSHSHRISQQACLKRIRKMLPDRPLKSLAYEHLQSFIHAIASRPKTARGTPMSVASVWNTVTALKLFLSHVEDMGQWKTDFNWRRALRLKRENLLTDEEREMVTTTKTFTVDELRTFWNRATERTRLYLLLGLNTGATQTEIATLRRSHLVRSGKQGFIERMRNKTRVPGRWPLWKETDILLDKHIAPEKGRTNPKGLALLNDDGDPLLDYTKAGRNDAITKAWQRLTCPPKLRELEYKVVGASERPARRENPRKSRSSFKILRKTAYSWIKQHHGTEVAEWFAQHKEPGMVAAYSDPVFKKVAVAVNDFRAKFLAPMFKDAPNPLRLSTAELVAGWPSRKS